MRLERIWSPSSKTGLFGKALWVCDRCSGLPRVEGRGIQPRIESFTTVNLFGSYDISHIVPVKSVQLTLNVDNLFNVDPPYSAFNLGATLPALGRVVTVGVRAGF